MANKAGHRRFGSIRKLPSGRFQIRYPGPDGKLRSGETTYERERDAERALSLLEAKMMTGDRTDPQRSKVKLGDYAAKWITELPHSRCRRGEVGRVAGPHGGPGVPARRSGAGAAARVDPAGDLREPAVGRDRALRRMDLDVNAGTVSVRQQHVESDTGELLAGPPKSRAGLRTVAIPEAIIPALRQHLDQFTEWEPTALVFAGANGGILRRSNFQRAAKWSETTRKLGVPGLHFHDLRHTGNTIAARVLPQLTALAEGAATGHLLQRADQLKVERLLATLAAVTTLTSNIKDLDRRIPPLLEELGCTLTEVCGIGAVTAMQLLVEVGDPQRFRTEAQFARWCGIAPVALSSGEGHGPARRHRLDLGGNRDVNSILHTVHVTQIRCHPPAKTYMARKTAENKTKREARRSHKRQLANVIIRHMWRDDANRRPPRPTPPATS
ncbi:transposase [Microbispora bryophytorum]|uniref:transposase n=1 Tax=Microbispora bryophytorum TaxID=1460882 RepID=UPI0033FFEF8C